MSVIENGYTDDSDLRVFFSEDPDVSATQWDDGPQAQALDTHSTIQGRLRNNEVGP
jgi:hypothetical protein